MPSSFKNHTPTKIALVADFVEEGWLSMDRVAESLYRELKYFEEFNVEFIRPSMVRNFDKIPGLGRGRTAHNLDRLLNRFVYYPMELRRVRNHYDIFHIIDHSYSQLIHVLDPRRVLVTCHDLDTFQCLLDPAENPTDPLFRAMTSHILSGFRKASRVTCDSHATLSGVLRYGLMSEPRTHLCRMGVDDSFFAAFEAGYEPLPLTLIHVGSTIQRKRIDILLKTFSEIRKRLNHVRLIRIGDPFTNEQQKLAENLGVGEYIDNRVNVPEKELCQLLARSTLLLLPSKAEGFGLPVVEAMAAGTPVLCSDLPVLREVGGDVAQYAPVGDVDNWAYKACSLLEESLSSPNCWHSRENASRRQAEKFTWASMASNCVAIYKEIFEELSLE